MFREFYYITIVLFKRIVMVPLSIILFILFHYFGFMYLSTYVLKYAINHLGGLFIKTVQFIASRELWIESYPEYQKVLDGFYDNASNIHVSIIENQLSRQGIRLNWINYKPSGSGSIAQVHRALLWDEDIDVVVKVKKPIAEIEFHIDLYIIEIFLYLLTIWIGEIPSTPFLYEFIQCVKREFDFNCEARMMIKARQWIQNDEKLSVDIVIPRVYIYSNHVIVMEYLRHKKLSSKICSSIPMNKRIGMSESLSRFFAMMIMTHKFVYTDPHIGNICLSKSDKFIIFDWGQHKNLSEDTVRGLAYIISSQNLDMNVLKYGLQVSGIDLKSISLNQIISVIQFFNHTDLNDDHRQCCWTLIRELVKYTIDQSKNERNPFKKNSKEMILILKTHDLLEMVMNKMQISQEMISKMFPNAMLEFSEKIITKMN